VTFYDRGTLLPIGMLRVLGGSTLNLAGELVELKGGSNSYTWATEKGNTTAEMSLKPKELPSFLFNLLLGDVAVDTASDPGSVTALINGTGVSLFNATTGIASVSVKAGAEASVKFGAYVVRAVSATTVDVYGVTNVDFDRGTDKSFENDALKITATPLTITSGAAVEVPGFGVELTGGSGTIAMITDDTASYTSDPPSSLMTSIKIGKTGACLPEVGAFVTAQKQSDGSMWLFDVYRAIFSGFPFGMEEKAFNEAEITGKILFDSAKNGIMEARYIKPNTAC